MSTDLSTSTKTHMPTSTRQPGLGRRRRTRALAVAAAVVSALAVWAVAELLLGIDLHEPPRSGLAPRDIGAINTVLAAAVASLGGWGLLALLERWTRRARTIWTAAAGAVFAVSLLPLAAPGLPAAQRSVLVVMHVVVAGVVIGMLRRTARSSVAA